MESMDRPVGLEVERDRFRLLFTNSRPKMPEGHSEVIGVTPTRQQIRERMQSGSTKR